MTSKTEVAEVSEVAEKGGMGKSLFLDLPISNCHGSSDHIQACDLDKSYVFINGTDEFVNDDVNEKDMSVSPESEAAATVEERGNGELDGTGPDLIKPMNEGDIGDRPVENGGSGESESSQVGKEDVVSAFEKSGKAEVEQTDAGLVKEKAGDQTGTAEGVAEPGSFGDLKKSETHPSPVENRESIAGALEFPTESAENEELTDIRKDKILIDECMHQNDESSVGKSHMSQGSEVGVVDVVECKSQDLSLVPEDEEKLSLEVVEATEQEVPPLTSSELDMELHTINSKEEWRNGDAKTTSLLDMHENQQLDMSGDDSGLVVLEHGNRASNVVSSVNCPVECVNDLAVEEKNEESFASHVARDIQYPEEPVKCNGGSGLPSETIQAVTTEVLESDKTLPALHCENPVAKATETVSALPVDGKTIHVMESTLPDHDQIINGTSKLESSTPVPTVDDVVTQEEADDVLTEKEPTLQGDEGAAESEILNGLAEVPDSQPATLDLKLESGVHVQTFSAVTKGEKVEILSGTLRTGVIDSLTTENGSVDNAAVGIEAFPKNQNMGDKVDRAAEDCQVNVFLAEHEAIGESGSCRADSFNAENGSADNAVVGIEDFPKNRNMGDKFDHAAAGSQENVFLAEHEAIGQSGSCRTEVTDSFNMENESVDNSVVEIEDVQTNQDTGDKFDSADGESRVNLFQVEHEATGESETAGANEESGVHVHDFSATSTVENQDAVPGSCRTEVLYSCNVVNEGVADSGLGIEDVQSMGDRLEGVAGVSHDNALQEKEATGKSKSFNVKLEPEVDAHDLPAITSEEKNDTESAAHGAEVLDSSNSSNGVADTVAAIEFTKNMSDSCPASVIHENECLQENEAAGKSDCDNKSGAESEGSLPNMCFREEASVKTETKPFNFLVRIPRFDDDNLKEQIRLAKLNVDEKTKLRDAIQALIQEKRAGNQVHGIDYEFAKEEGRSARKLVRSKRMEIDSLQSMINKAKNALSIDDIDSQIHNMEHMIQHETLPLKEEKQFIRDIKQLKQLREQLSSNLGSRAEIKNALEQREEVEERLKMLRKELDVLKDKVLKAEAAAAEAEKRYDDENRKVRELQTQFRAADDVRQSAYAQLQNLRKELSKKNKHFFKYKDTAAVANNYAFSGNSEALYFLCTDNVQNFMDLWNTDDEFRKEYVRCNIRSTIRRLGTLDGRSLGPDEQPIILPKYADERNGSTKSTPMKVDVAPHPPVKEVQQQKTNEIVASNGLPRPKVTEHRKQKVAIEEPDVALIENGSDHVSVGDAIDQVQEEPKKSAKEMELIRKTEELRRDEDEAKLKEVRRLEALAKADEARERKKRRAEKLQMRAELKVQKEAEEREKERERRLRKKERKKAAPIDANNTNHISEAAVSSESTPETIKDIANASPKKPQKAGTSSTKQKSKSVPAALRNRNKKKLQQWMWVVFSSLIIIFLFWLGNVGMFSNKNLKWRSPVQ